jgi:hypothetical protein
MGHIHPPVSRAHHGDGGHALHGEGEEDEQGDGAAGSEILAQGFLQIQPVGIRAVNGAQGADDGFARGERRDQADADLPIEAERLDQGFNGAAHGAGEAMLDGLFPAGVGHVGHHPEDHGDQQDDGPGAVQEDLGAVEKAQAERLQGGPA